MTTKLVTAATITLALLSPATAHAATTPQAKRAVQDEIRTEYHHKMAAPVVTCKRLTSTKFSCDWTYYAGYSTYEGSARVTYYGRTADVILF